MTCLIGPASGNRASSRLAARRLCPKPAGGYSLLIYNTGHGAHAVGLPFGYAIEIIGATNVARRWRFRLVGGFDTSVNPDASPPDTTDADSMDNIQLSFKQAISSGVSLAINGVSLGPISSSLTTNPLPLTPIVTTSTVSYAVRISHALLSPPVMTVELSGPSSQLPDDATLLTAADVAGGDQDFLFTGTPTGTPSCTDGMLDGTETDVDCGGSCAPCGLGQGCGGALDCASGVCSGQVCQPPVCTGPGCSSVPALPAQWWCVMAMGMIALGAYRARGIA